jgi:transcription antitermination protein NusB
MARRPNRPARARSLARKFAMQALYQWQLTGHSVADLRNQFAVEEGFDGVDREYFLELVQGVIERTSELDATLADLADRPLEQLDPVERAVLLIGIYELRQRAEVPYRVVINEGVELAKRFGATEAHKYVNAVLDRAAYRLRAAEKSALASSQPR